VKSVTYPMADGTVRTVEYDENSPCTACGLPVMLASMGGTRLCPWCDCAVHRDGTKWTFDEALNRRLLRRKAEELWKRLKRPGPKDWSPRKT